MSKLTPKQIIAIEARWAGVQYTAPQTDDEGYLHVALDSGHSVGWDIEGAGGCCKTHLVRIAAAPTDIAALLANAAALEAENAALRIELADAALVFEAGDKLASVAEDIVLGISRYAIKPSDEPFTVDAPQIVALKAAYEEFHRVLNGEDAANE